MQEKYFQLNRKNNPADWADQVVFGHVIGLTAPMSVLSSWNYQKGFITKS